MGADKTAPIPQQNNNKIMNNQYQNSNSMI